MMMQNLNLTTEQLRGLVLKSLSGLKGGQMADLFKIVSGHAANARGDTAVQAGHIGPRYTAIGYMRGEQQLSQTDKGWVQNLFWDMVIEGIVRPGLGDGMNNKLPHFHVTEWGKQVLADDQASSHAGGVSSERAVRSSHWSG